MNTEKIMKDIQTVQDNIREIKSTWGNTIMTLDNIKSGLKADVQKKVDEAYQQGLEDGKKSGYEKGLNEVGTYQKGRVIGYEEGYEDGKNSIDNGCDGCKWESKKEDEEPCKHCRNAYRNEYTPMPKDDSIKVGDEVINNTTGTKGILVAPETKYLLATVVVPSNRWNTFNISHTNLTKTGKHYDIQSILEAMQYDSQD